jgi:geranylgeranyl pyrophosphate synthase
MATAYPLRRGDLAARVISFRAPVAYELEQVDLGLARVFPNDESLLGEVSEHLLSAKGKKFRPALLLLTAEMVGGVCEEDSVAAAVVVELVHMATLIHDDTVDKSLTRRGKPTVHSRWSEDVSIIMGDYVYSKAFKMLAGLNMYGAMAILAQSTHEMTIGEMAQIETKWNFDATEDDYMTIIEKKTASLIAAACEIGAMTGGSHEGESRICSSFGRQVGLAFQIMDDILDFLGDEAVLGKPRGSDIKGGDMTLPMIAALGHAPGRDRRRIRDLALALETGSKSSRTRLDDGYGEDGDTDGNVEARRSEDPAGDGGFDELVGLIEKHGGFEYARDTAARCAREAGRLLLSFESSPSREALLSAADYVVRRDF